MEELQQLAEANGYQVNTFIIPLDTSREGLGLNTAQVLPDEKIIQIRISLKPEDGFITLAILNEINEAFITASDFIKERRYTNGEHTFNSISNTRELQIATYIRDWMITDKFFRFDPNDKYEWKDIFDNLNPIAEELNHSFQNRLYDETFYGNNINFINKDLAIEHRHTFARLFSEEIFRKTSLPFKMTYNEESEKLEISADPEMSLLTPKQKEEIRKLLEGAEHPQD